jgi:hypothetical protein
VYFSRFICVRFVFILCSFCVHFVFLLCLFCVHFVPVFALSVFADLMCSSSGAER